MMKKIFPYMIFLLFSVSFAFACTVNTECASGEVCDSSVCVAACTSGNTACSDGVDNDGVTGIDFRGACSIDGVSSSCSSLNGASYDTTADEIACSDACTALSGLYTSGDSDCVSPLDISEDSSAVASAPSYGSDGFWAKLIGWLIFWD